MTKTWRLGLDVGTNSLGWAALELEEHEENYTPCRLMGSGVRIFSDGRDAQDGVSNAATRRDFRGARKNRDRALRRRTRLMAALIKYNLMPGDEAARKALEARDPWILRARALDEQIEPCELGRALYHLHQRRGFKSNRKTDREDSEKGKVKEAIKRTKERLQQEGARTLGELFGGRRWENHQHNQQASKSERKPQPGARVKRSGEGTKWQYEYYPTRELIMDEFDQLWQRQKAFHPGILTEEAREELRNAIEWQHDLKPQPIGKCTLIPTDPRAAKALPSVQHIRVYQEVNHLRVQRTGHASRLLSLEERDKIADKLLHPTNKQAKLTFSQLGKLLGLSQDESFNLESANRQHLLGDETAAKMMQPERWGKEWFALDLEKQDRIINTLNEEESDTTVIQWLAEEFDFDEDQAERIADCPLPAGYGRLGRKAISQILPELKQEVISYDEACARAGFHHSQLGTGEIHDTLPYYGSVLERQVAFSSGEPDDIEEKRLGKLANPTVHVAMNQIRKVVNDLIDRFGRPEQIVVEMARDLPMSAKGKKEHNKQQAENTKANEKRARELVETYGQPNNYQNRLRLRLWEELEALDKRCVFSGEQICSSVLFSDQVEIEHILPFSRTYDDGIGNKVLSMRQANRDKGNRTPSEAFGHSPSRYNWDKISARAAQFPSNKKWRFAPDAMETFLREHDDFLARQLNDTRYIGRLARQYLEALYGGQGYAGSTNHVWVVTGRLTSDLRHQWGLNSVLLGDNLSEDEKREMQKNRDDHRHHAIDAIVIACTDRHMLQKAANEAQKKESLHDHRLLANTPYPWEGFREDVKDNVRKIIISHKPDHGYQGAILEDTAYGLIAGEEGEPDKSGKRDVVVRKALENLKEKDLADIRDERLKYAFIQATQGQTGKDFTQALLTAGEEMQPPVRKVRLLLKNRTVRPIADRQGKEYKAYVGGSNYCCDIWQNPDGSWDGEIISTFEAYQLARADQNWWCKLVGRNAQPLVMRLRKGDYLELDFEGRRAIVQVYKMDKANGVYFVEHFQANYDQRMRKKELPRASKSVRMLQKLNARYATVSPSGVLQRHNPD